MNTNTTRKRINKNELIKEINLYLRNANQQTIVTVHKILGFIQFVPRTPHQLKHDTTTPLIDLVRLRNALQKLN